VTQGEGKGRRERGEEEHTLGIDALISCQYIPRGPSVGRAIGYSCPHLSLKPPRRGGEKGERGKGKGSRSTSPLRVGYFFFHATSWLDPTGQVSVSTSSVQESRIALSAKVKPERKKKGGRKKEEGLDDLHQTTLISERAWEDG